MLIYNKHSIPFSSPPKAYAFRGPRIKQTYLPPLQRVRVSGGDLCTLVQKHRPSREARQWVQLVALGGIGKIARTSSPCYFLRFSSLASGSELCKAQETRGSKFTCEFGRNSTVYCFVASGNKVQLPLAKNEIYLTFSKSNIL